MFVDSGIALDDSVLAPDERNVAHQVRAEAQSRRRRLGPEGHGALQPRTRVTLLQQRRKDYLRVTVEEKVEEKVKVEMKVEEVVVVEAGGEEEDDGEVEDGGVSA